MLQMGVLKNLECSDGVNKLIIIFSCCVQVRSPVEAKVDSSSLCVQ
jgi:hypothetical protein